MWQTTPLATPQLGLIGEGKGLSQFSYQRKWDCPFCCNVETLLSRIGRLAVGIAWFFLVLWIPLLVVEHFSAFFPRESGQPLVALVSLSIQAAIGLFAPDSVRPRLVWGQLLKSAVLLTLFASSVVAELVNCMTRAARRVVVTGVGVISPLGSTKEALWEALSGGRSGVGMISFVSTDGKPAQVAAEAKQFSGEIDDFGPLEKELKKAIRKGLKVMCRECQMGVAVAQLALADSGLKTSEIAPERCGISFGTTTCFRPPRSFPRGSCSVWIVRAGSNSLIGEKRE